MESIVFNVEPRDCDKNAAKKLRNQGKVPAVVYHKGEETIHICVDERSLKKMVHSSESHLIDLTFPDGKAKRSFLKEVQFDPVTDNIIHADFQFFSAGEVLEMDVPTAFIGEGEAPGVVAGGNVQVILHALKVKAVPSNIPQHITIDVSGMELGQTMHIREIPVETYEGKFEIINDPDSSVVSVVAPKVEAEVIESAEEEETPAVASEEE
ncbi:MAG: 50S ribosomal protein L25/general stress protein Ctc [Chlorobium sp.]|nr:50S ribosomal protein L25/general stress protein Ctc [Chlorobium sp.]MCW8816121.1 50S ribosomal protein L25/general stress protein Ctc [Chlorobium sp.]MCW8820161.1 50S ribosomal protein L25/general stress protein Ctc [Ignavibacteriaceae bacterium]